MTDTVRADVQTLWDYMHVDMAPAKSDVIVGFGCYDELIPLRAAELYKAGYAPLVVFSGGLGRNTAGLWHTSEAERFAALAREAGVPENAILLETHSANAAENYLFTKALLAEENIPAVHVLAVHKPYMERRVFAAVPIYWPEADFIITSPQVTVDEHIAAAQKVGMTEKGVIETLVGDVQRMALYPCAGYQIPQFIPPAVREAYDRLTAVGYTGQLIQ